MSNKTSLESHLNHNTNKAFPPQGDHETCLFLQLTVTYLNITVHTHIHTYTLLLLVQFCIVLYNMFIIYVPDKPSVFIVYIGNSLS